MHSIALPSRLSQITRDWFLARAAGQQLKQIFTGEVLLYLRETDNSIVLRFGEDAEIARHAINAIVAQWVAGTIKWPAGTDTLPNAALFVPLVTFPARSALGGEIL